jgi:hypothetical protein
VRPPPEEGLSARVYLDPGFKMIGLAMSRSIGFHNYLLFFYNEFNWCYLLSQVTMQ